MISDPPGYQRSHRSKNQTGLKTDLKGPLTSSLAIAAAAAILTASVEGDVMTRALAVFVACMAVYCIKLGADLDRQDRRAEMPEQDSLSTGYKSTQATDLVPKKRHRGTQTQPQANYCKDTSVQTGISAAATDDGMQQIFGQPFVELEGLPVRINDCLMSDGSQMPQPSAAELDGRPTHDDEDYSGIEGLRKSHEGRYSNAATLEDIRRITRLMSPSTSDAKL